MGTTDAKGITASVAWRLERVRIENRNPSTIFLKGRGLKALKDRQADEHRYCFKGNSIETVEASERRDGARMGFASAQIPS